jgi:hypothetical protein
MGDGRLYTIFNISLWGAMEDQSAIDLSLSRARISQTIQEKDVDSV